MILSVLLLAGCTTTTTMTEVHVNGDAPRGSINIPVPPDHRAGSADAPAAKPARDPAAPPVTLAGEESFAMTALVRESSSDRGRMRVREPCGGALLAAPPGAPDPRTRYDALRYTQTHTLLDERGHGWLTDRYVDAGEPANASLMVWVQNVGGGRGWRADDGASHCPSLSHNGTAYNILLHAEGVETLELRFAPAGRPADPAAPASSASSSDSDVPPS